MRGTTAAGLILAAYLVGRDRHARQVMSEGLAMVLDAIGSRGKGEA